MRKSILIAALALAGCSDGAPDGAQGTPDGSPPKSEAQGSETPDLAKPIAQPMRVRDRLLHDLAEQKGKAKDRGRALDQVIGR